VKPVCRCLARLLPLLLVLALLSSGCSRHSKNLEVAYVSAPQAFLRDQVAAVYNKTGVVKNGDRVQVLDRDRRFARVRLANGTEGWIEQRNLVSQQVYDGFQKLLQQEQSAAVQATGITRNDTNIHLDPRRDADHLFLLGSGSKVALLKRTASEKALPGTAPKPALNPGKGKEPAGPAMEDWWLIRDEGGHVGWVLGRMIDIDVPLEIAQYAEGQRIIACFKLDEVADADKRVPQYLVLMSENKDGLPYDYSQIRVFTWNVRKHRYETAYHERDLTGVLPVTVSHENFDKEGTLPVFVVRVQDDGGNISERKYKLNSPIVRRVLAPGEEAPKAVKKKRR
jgi:SH3-like domain-containing protein